MGGTKRIALEAAEVIAAAVVHHLEPFAKRIEIAGSIRRRKESVGDIEIVMIPKLYREKDMFGDPSGPIYDKIDEGIASYSRSEKFGGGALVKKNDGSKYLKLHETVCDVQIDLFVVRPPAEWGPIFAIRTGSADFSKNLMISLKAHGLRSEDGRVLDAKGNHVPCPEEEDFFKAAGVKWRPPEQRK